MTAASGQVLGVQPVLEALARPGQVDEVLIARDKGGATRRIEQAARQAGVRIKLVPKEALDRMAGGSAHQGVVAALRTAGLEPIAFDALLEKVAGVDHALLVLLDGIQDPGNLGAILRSAYALGAHGVVVPKDRSAALGPTAVKASAGAALHIPVAEVVNLKHALDPLAEAGFWSFAATLEGAAPSKVDLRGRVALVMGGEQKGVRPTLAKRCDHRICIPMVRSFDSLNASVATGILLYEVARQRASKTVDSDGGPA